MTASPDIQTETNAERGTGNAEQSAIGNRQSAIPEYSWRHWRPHPFLSALTPEEIALRVSASRQWREEIVAAYKAREKKIKLAETPGQLLQHAFEPECWRDADRDLAEARTEGRDYGGVYAGGGKRSTKTSWGVRTLLRSALTYPGGIIWVFQRTLSNSIITVQRQIWEWMPEWARKLNDVAGKRKNDDPTKIRYTPDGGFAAGNIVLPNSTLIMFLSYDMEPKNYQGAEIGAGIRVQVNPPHWPWIASWQPNGIALDRHGLPIPNIGALLDEDAPLAWVQTVRDRLTTRNAKFVWTFTTENGITLAVKTVLGTAVQTETRPVDDTLPSDRVLVPGCPIGHVPYRQRTSTPGVNAIYFHTRFNKFGTNYENMAAQYRGRDSKQILANLFGYSEDLTRRVWPLFGGWNIIEESELPAEGTNYLFGDPGGSRNFTFMWLRVSPGPGADDWYIFDEWPDAQTYGEWALPDDSPEANPNGIAGPAQRSLGWGTQQYKQMILRREAVQVPESRVESRESSAERLAPGSPEWHTTMIRFGLQDPMRRRIAEQELSGRSTLDPRPSTLSLPVRDRYLDPRAAGTEEIANRGGRTLIDKFNDTDKDKSGSVLAPAMFFRPAPGLAIHVGIEAVNRLLYFDKDQEIIRGLNAPRLHVVRKCRQTIWALENFSIRRGRDENEASYDGACKDFADLPRYAATTNLRYIAPGALQTRGGGRSY